MTKINFNFEFKFYFILLSMGYDISQFVDSDRISSSLICTICTDVLRDPVMIDECEHVYCQECLETWLESSETCPADRKPVDGNFRPAPRMFRNMIDELAVRCPYADKGCSEAYALGQAYSHAKNCFFGVETCSGNCGARLMPEEIEKHDCVAYLLAQVEHFKNLWETSKSHDLSPGTSGLKKNGVEDTSGLKEQIRVLQSEKNYQARKIQQLEADKRQLESSGCSAENKEEIDKIVNDVILKASNNTFKALIGEEIGLETKYEFN